MVAKNDPRVCPLCGQTMGANDQVCCKCRAAAPWRDYAAAIGFARDEFAGWCRRGLIGESQCRVKDHQLADLLQSAAAAARDGKDLPPDTGLPPPSTCWQCRKPVAGFGAFCNGCGSPLGQGADALRYLAFLARQVGVSEGRELTLAQSHGCLSDINSHAAALRAELRRSRLSQDALSQARLTHLREMKEAAHGGREHSAASAPIAPPPIAPSPSDPAPTAAPPPLPPPSPDVEPPPSPRRSFLEILLDPRSIQWLLASGALLLVVGGVVWLASLGVFKNVLFVAACMGVGTIALLSGGFAVVKFTRYQLAGRAVTLLACLIMPLNLWFYQTHHLVTLDGHLWAAALICCVLYAAAAAVLKDPVFIYVLAAGVALTGLLILADLHRAAEIAGPSTLLVVLGLIALHAERAFAEGESPFSRQRFGMACFWSAQALLGAGLALLLGAQIAGSVPPALSFAWPHPAIVTDQSQRFLAIGLVLAGAYACLYSDFVVRRKGVYVYIAALMLVWAELLAIDLANLARHPSVLIGALAATSLLVNLAQWLALGRTGQEISRLLRPLSALGMFLALGPVLIGLVLHLRAVNADWHQSWPYSITWAYVGAMAFTAVCCRISAYLAERRQPGPALFYLAATAAVSLVGAAGLLSMVGMNTWPEQSAVLMVIPNLYLLASWLYAGRPGQKPLKFVAHLATIVLAVTVLASALQIVRTVVPVSGVQTNLSLGLFCAEAAIFYALAAGVYGGGANVYLASTAACGAVWQVLNFFNLRGEYYCVTFALLGMAMLLAYRLALWERAGRRALAVAAFQCANAILSLSLAAAALMALSRLAVGRADWSLAILLAVFGAVGLSAAGLVRVASFRRAYIALSVVEGTLAFIVAQSTVHLSPWQNVEVFCVAAGALMLLIGFALWYREQDRQSDGASACLLFGSLLAGVPLAIATLVNRFGFHVSLADEIGLSTVSVLMLVSGFMCRLRAPTLIGGGLLLVHLATLLLFVGMSAQLAVGVYLTLGGVALFGLGVALSVYREKLLSLPQQIKQHDGVFRVLAWR